MVNLEPAVTSWSSLLGWLLVGFAFGLGRECASTVASWLRRP